MKNKRYVVKNKFRFTLFIVLIISIVVIGITSLIKFNKAYGNIYIDEYKEIMVKKGDTIWELALSNLPNDMNLSKFIYEIKEINSMKDYTIYEGDLILLPMIKK